MMMMMMMMMIMISYNDDDNEDIMMTGESEVLWWTRESSCWIFLAIFQRLQARRRVQKENCPINRAKNHDKHKICSIQGRKFIFLGSKVIQ